MPDSITEGVRLFDSLRSLAFGMIGGGAAMIAFFNRFQTKGGCKKEHVTYEKLQKARRDLQAADLKTVVVQQQAIHETVERIETLVHKIASDVYVPRTARTREGD